MLLTGPSTSHPKKSRDRRTRRRAHTRRQRPEKLKKEKEAKPGGLKMYKKGAAAGCYYTDEARRDTMIPRPTDTRSSRGYTSARTHIHKGRRVVVKLHSTQFEC